MRLLPVCLALILSLSGCNSQSNDEINNLDFEQNGQDRTMPDKWFTIGNHTVSVDSTQVISGKYSTIIKSGSEEGASGAILNIIGASPKGQKVRLEGYMKLDNVKEGMANLTLSINRNGSVLAYSDLKSENIRGTRDWSKYSISAKLPNRTSQIHVGGSLSGTGSVWFDDFNIYVDGKNISTIGKENRIELHEKLSLTGAEISLNELPAGANVPFVHSHKENEEI